MACVEYLREIGWPAIQAHEQALAARFLAGLPEAYTLHGPRAVVGRVPTFALTLPGRTPAELASELAAHGIASWSGNYYAVEIMERLGLADGALRIGFVHYNSEADVDAALTELARLAA